MYSLSHYCSLLKGMNFNEEVLKFTHGHLWCVYYVPGTLLSVGESEKHCSQTYHSLVVEHVNR